MDFYKPIVRFLTKERAGSSDNSDMNDQSYIVRLILLVLSIFYLISTVFIITMSGVIPSMVSIAGFVVALALFVLSYYINSSSIATLMIVATVFVNTVLAIEWGPLCGFQGLIAVGIAIAFGSVMLSLHTKFMVSIFICIYIGILNCILHGINPVFSPSTELVAVFNITTTIFSVIYLTVISYYFCIKFTEAEHKVYVYNRQLKKMASLDPLTNLMNRRGMSESLPDLQHEYMEGLHGLSIAIGDIDFFKKINDQYGHDCGDYILKSISDIFSQFMEGKGEVCRWGGEEFLFAFTEHNPDNVFVYLNDLRHTIKHTHFKFNDNEIRVTMTFGLEEYAPNQGIDATIKNADEKLYLGKESGRDKVVY